MAGRAGIRSYSYSTLLEQEVGWSSEPLVGDLQTYLYEGEYENFKSTPIFESNFMQITKKGYIIDIHNRMTIVTLGIAATSPHLSLPDIVLLAHLVHTELDKDKKKAWSFKKASDVDTCSSEPGMMLQLTRLLPLKYVKLSIHRRLKYCLKMKLASGRSFYLKLFTEPENEEQIFDQWLKLISMLRTGGPASEKSTSSVVIPSLTGSGDAVTTERGHSLDGSGDGASKERSSLVTQLQPFKSQTIFKRNEITSAGSPGAILDTIPEETVESPSQLEEGRTDEYYPEESDEIMYDEEGQFDSRPSQEMFDEEYEDEYIPEEKPKKSMFKRLFKGFSKKKREKNRRKKEEEARLQGYEEGADNWETMLPEGEQDATYWDTEEYQGEEGEDQDTYGEM